MKYFLLCALVIAGAFFYIPSYAESGVFQCEPGETVLIGIGCGKSAPLESCSITRITPGYPLGTNIYPSVSSLQSALNALNTTHSPHACSQVFEGNTMSTVTSSTWSMSFDPPNCPPGSQTQLLVPVTFTRNVTTTHTSKSNQICTRTTSSSVAETVSKNIQVVYTRDGTPECPETHPLGPIYYDREPVIGHFCYRLPPEPQCDCANFAGDSLNTSNTLRAPKGQYTNENPPQCVMQQEFVAGRDTPLTCTCQVSAQKWMKTNSGFENGVEYERWETLPTTQGQPSGTFTGVKCGSTDGGPLEPENNAPKECFTLPNGVRWCWADKAEKCQVVNGVEQCASGCGTVNGDFVCYDDKPVIPPKDRDNLTPPDDTLTDPSKSINDMVKSDFKEVNKGVESRLDNVVTSISNATIAMDEVSDKVGLTNSKLDGIGMQLDGVGKQLGAIDGKLEGAFGDKGQPMPGTGDGKNCHEEVCSWYESAYPDGLVGIWEERSLALQQTALFDFVNQFSFEPSGSQPEMQLCFNLASYANFGCFSLEIPAFVWVFLRVCILFSAAMLCRALIFGG